jgi:outer membrane protein OmpA-like peptidoglycan-associated protein
VTVATVGLATLGVVQALPNRNAVQSQLTDRSTRALSAAGITDARVQFDGRDATVHVRSAGDRDRALAIVRSQEGVRVAHVIVDRGAPGAGKTQGGRPPSPLVAPSRLVPGPVMPPSEPPGQSAPVTAKSAPPAPSAPPSPPMPTGSAIATTSASPGATSAGTSSPGHPGPGATASAPPPGATAETVARIQNAVNACGPIQFASASTALTPAGRKVLANVAAILRAESSVDVEIQGFTDAIGPASANLALSRARARTVYDTLRVLGIAAARMSPVGYGESHPRVPNDSRAHRAANRRVAFAVRVTAP